MSKNDEDIYENEEEELDEQTGNLLFALIKQLNGRVDLTKVTIPAEFLEARSLLEMYADMNGYPQLLAKCTTPDDPLERFIQVLKWYFSTVGRRRGTRKPYNPLLGECFRCEWDLTNVDGENLGTSRFLAEQVSHHPPTSAFYVENQDVGVIYNGHITTKSQFLGNSVGVVNVGEGRVILTERDNEEYVLTYPKGYVRNILLGTMRFELGGETQLFCEDTGYTADIEFVTKGMIFGEWDKVKGTIKDEDGNTLYSLEGYWNKEITMKDKKSKEETVLFGFKEQRAMKKKDVPMDQQHGIESQTKWKKVADALAEKDVVSANEGKTELEERQRAERKEREESGDVWETRFFFQDDNDNWTYGDIGSYAENYEAVDGKLKELSDAEKKKYAEEE